MKAENDLIQLSHMMRSTKKGLRFVRQSRPIGSVTHTLLEIGLFHAGGMDTQHNAMLLWRMTSIYGLNYMYVVQAFYHIVYSECHDNQIKNPSTVSIDTKPPQINLYHSICHRGSQDKHQPQPQMMPPMGFPPMMGANFYPSPFMNPWSMMGQGPQGASMCRCRLAAPHCIM
jgi:hypothetical protein